MSGQPLAIPWRQAWHANQGPTSTTRTALVDDTSLQGRRHLSPTQAGHLAPSLRKSYTLQIPCPRVKGINRQVCRPQFYPDWLAGRPQYMELFKAPARHQATKATKVSRGPVGPLFCREPRAPSRGPRYPRKHKDSTCSLRATVHPRKSHCNFPHLLYTFPRYSG